MYRCPGRVANFFFFLALNKRRDQPWAITLETEEKNSGHGNRNLCYSIKKSIAKNKVLKKTNENKKKKGKKRFKIFISIKLPEDFMPLGFLTS